MSILEDDLNRAATLGINPTTPIDEQGMAYALTKADQLGLVTYKTGMAAAWLQALQVNALARHTKIPSFARVLGGVLWAAQDPHTPSWPRPADLIAAMDAYTHQQLTKTLAGRQQFDIPQELADNPTGAKRFLAAAIRAGMATGDYTQAVRQARRELGLPPDPPRLPRATPPREITSRIKSLFGKEK